MRRTAERLLEACLVSYAVALTLRPLDEADSFFHLSLGRAVLRSGARVVPEPTAFAEFTDPAVASEWLWSVLSYAAFSCGGYRALCWLGAGLAGAAAYSLLAFVRSELSQDTPRPWGVAALAVLGMTVVACRLSVRPELCVLIGLPLYLRTARAYALAEPPRRWRLGGALALGSLLWAQVHGSFVLAPALFVISVFDPRALDRRQQLQGDGLVFAALLAAQLTSAYGLEVSGFIGSHAAGDATRYIGEMSRPTWAMLNPFAAPNMFAYASLLGLGAAGALLERRSRARELLLAALGCALLATANRFIAEAALLALPWAAAGARVLGDALSGRALLLTRAASALGASALLVLTAREMDAVHGPLGRTGVTEHAFAWHAVNALTALPPGAAVATDYTNSAVLGFLGRDHLRTFVDGRTPLYFDDTDFAVAREMQRDGGALRRGLVRYGSVAAVAHRDSQACQQLAGSWSVAAIEPLFTTFVREPAARAFTRLRPCGTRYLDPASCADPGLAEEIARTRALGAQAFASFLDAERSAECGGDAARALATLHALERSARPYRRNFRRVLVLAALRAGALPEAAQHMLDAIADDDPGMIALLQAPGAGALPLTAARRILESYLDHARDEAEVAARAALAEICARAGDEDCARFNAIRAAVRGQRTQALEWLSAHHSSERARRDAQHWLQLLQEPPLRAAGK